MRSLICLILFLSVSAICFSQQDSLKSKNHLLEIGSGTIGYMNSFYLPGGLCGYSLSGKYTFKTEKGNNSSRISYFSIVVNYSRLENEQGELSLCKPTDLYNLTVDYKKLYHIGPNRKIKVFLGYNLGVTSNLCQTPYYTYDSYYQMPVFGYWNLFTGINSLIRFTKNNFTIENKTMVPFLMYGYFFDYQNYYDFKASYLVKRARFTSIRNYVEFENHLSLYYSGIQIKKRKWPIFITYSFINHTSDINYNIQKFRKSTIYLGLIVK